MSTRISVLSIGPMNGRHAVHHVVPAGCEEEFDLLAKQFRKEFRGMRPASGLAKSKGNPQNKIGCLTLPSSRATSEVRRKIWTTYVRPFGTKVTASHIFPTGNDFNPIRGVAIYEAPTPLLTEEQVAVIKAYCEAGVSGIPDTSFPVIIILEIDHDTKTVDGAIADFDQVRFGHYPIQNDDLMVAIKASLDERFTVAKHHTKKYPVKRDNKLRVVGLY